MGKVIAMAGGGGADSDELTANRSHVLSGYTAITHDSDGEPTTGTMPNNGAQSGALNCGQSKTIPAGYTTGGTVTANSLASQTSANAGVGQILTGYNAWVNGSKVTGNMANRGAVNQSLGINGSYTIPAGYHNGSGKVTQNIGTMGGQTIAPSASQQTVSCSGKYMTGNVVVNSVANLSAANIKRGVTVGGVTGTCDWAVSEISKLVTEQNITVSAQTINYMKDHSVPAQLTGINIGYTQYPYVVLACRVSLGRNWNSDSQVYILGIGGFSRTANYIVDASSTNAATVKLSIERDENKLLNMALMATVSGTYNIRLSIYGGTNADLNG